MAITTDYSVKNTFELPSLTKKAKSKRFYNFLKSSLILTSFVLPIPAIAKASRTEESRAVKLEAMADNAYRLMKKAGATSQELSEVRYYQSITDKAVLGVFNKYLQQGENALNNGEYKLAGQKYNSAKGIIKKAFRDDADLKYKESLELVSEKQKGLNKLIKEKKEKARKLIDKLRAGLLVDKVKAGLLVDKVKAGLLVDKVRTELNSSQGSNYTGKTLGDLLGTDEFADKKSYVPAFVVSKTWLGDSKWTLAEAVDYKIDGKTGKFTDATIKQCARLMGGSVKSIKTGNAIVIFNEKIPAYLNIKTKKGLVPATTIGDGTSVSVESKKGEKIDYQWFPGQERNVSQIKWGKQGFFGSNLWTPANMKSDSLENILSGLDLKKSSIIFYRSNINNNDEYVDSGEIAYLIIRPQEQIESKSNELVKLNECVDINPNHQTITLGKPKSSEEDVKVGVGATGVGPGPSPGGGVGPK